MMRNTFYQFDSNKLRQLVDEKRELYFHMMDTNKEFAELKQVFKEIKEMRNVLQEKEEKDQLQKKINGPTERTSPHGPF